MDDASPIEGFVQGNEYGEGGENGAMVNFVDLVMEDNEKMSTDGVLKELTESSSNDTEVKVNTIDQSTPIEAQDLPLPADSVIEMSIENSFKDDQDSLKEKPKIPLLDDVSLAHIGESAYHVESIPKEDSEMSMESNLQDPFEEPTKHSLHEPQETVKNDDQLVLKGLDLKEAQDPSVPADSIIKVNVDTSFEDAQESYETPLGRPSVRHGSLVGGFSRWIKPIGNYLPEPEAMVKIVDKVVSKLIPMEEEEDEVTSLTGESFLEENKETSLNDTKSHSSTEPLGSFSTADVSSIKGLVQGNESVEVGESTSDDQPAVVNYVESVIKEDKEMFMDSVREEPQLTVKTSDDLVMEAKSLEDVEDPSIPIESVNEVNVDTFFKDAPNEKLEGPSPAEVIHLGGAQDDMLQDKSIIEGNDATSLKDDQDYIKKTLGSTFPLDVSRVEGVLQEKEYDEADENEAMVNLVESVTKNNKEMSIEGVLEEVIRSSHDSKVMVNPVDQSTQKEAQDSSIPVESIIEENLETFFKDAPKEQQESPSPTKVIQLGEAQDDLLQDKSVIEENVVTSLKYAQDSFKETLGSTFLIDASPAECVVQEKEYDVDGKNGEIVNFVESVTKTNEEMSIEGDPGEPLEEVIRSSSNDSELTFEEAQVPSLPVKSITEASMKTSFKGDQDSWKETQYKSVPDASVIKVNVDTSFEDAQESFETPLGSPSVRHVSLVEGFTGWIKPIGQYLHTPEAMVRIVDQVVSKVIPMKETQETSLTVESVLEANKETSLNDTKAHSSTESLGSFSMADVSSIKGIVLGNECVEVGENACDDQPAVVNYVESVMKEDKEMSMKSVREEPQITVKTFDDLVMEAIPLKETENFSIPVESVIGVNVETFVKDAPIKQQESPSPAKVIHLGGAQDLQDKSIIEENDVRSLKYAQDSFKETLGSTFPVDVSRVEGFLQEKEYVEGGETIVNFVESVTKNNEEMSTQGVLEKVFKSYSHDSEVTVNPVDQSTLKEAQDPSLPVQSIVEENVETFFKDAPKEQLQSPSSAEVIHLGEAQDDLLQDKSVIEENVATSIIDDQDSFKETSSILVNVSPAEGVVQENEYDEDGQSRAILNFVESVTKDNEEMSIKGVHDESFEEVIRSSSHQSEVPLKEAEDPQTTVKMVDDLVMEAIPLKEAEDPSVPVELVIEVNVETSFKDVPKEKQESPSLAKVTFVSRNIHLNDYGIEPIEFSSHDETQSVVQTIDHVVLKVIRAGEAQDDLLRDNSVIKEDVLTSLKDAQDSFKETLGSTFLVDVSHVEGIVQEKEYDEGSKNGAIVNSVESATKNNEKMPIGVLEEPFEEVIRNSSHDLEVMVKTVDQSTLEDAQEYFGTPLGSPSVRHVSPVDQGFAEWDGTIKNSSRELHVIPMEETQEPSLLDEPVIEANKETSLKDAKDYSASESLGTFSMPDVSSMEAFVQGNEYAEVGEKAFEGPPLITNSGMSVLKDENEVSMEGDLTESFKEAIEPSSDELRAMTKTVDLLVQEPSVLGVLNEKECGENSTLVNQVKSLKNESEDLSMEGVLQESIGKPVGNSSYEQEAIKPSSDEDELRSMMKTVDLSVQDPSVPGIHNVKECGENATMVKVESLKKESEDLSIKGVLEESFEKPVGDSSHEQEEMENTVDRSILKAQDPTVPLVDTSFKDVQDSVPLERPSQLDVLPIEGFVQENEFDKVGESARHGSLVINNHGSSSVINGCHVCQRNAQSNEMVGLVRTLLEEIRRIRAFYEEGLRQTTQIDFHILQILEKFNSDEQI